eukprot:scaffold655_cov162-Amphora_coffeaeformis.AAC.15
MANQAIEAVFAGSRAECVKFMATTMVPPESCIVATDLVGLVNDSTLDDGDNQTMEEAALMLSWPVSNSLQARLLDGTALPRSSVQLDSFQEGVCRRPPPLVIESRSGTGKTLVLLQHAAYHHPYHNNDDECQKGRRKPACFVTVSPGLREELYHRFEEINETENLQLPETNFYTFKDLLQRLLRLKCIHDFDACRPCSFLSFKRAQTSFTKKEMLEPELVENEIGGVIVGSLVAGQQAAPLTREQYQEDVRSNVGRGTDSDERLRDKIYDEYEQYRAWKGETIRYDVGDIVLRLLQEDWKEEYFGSLYLDEVQDFSYAGTFLLFQLAGKSRIRWVCAGDPAQMISPGCSFTFDGLKQVMLGVKPGIERHLSGVSHLFVNYRTTKDVLDVANQVLQMIRSHFPGAITFARPETARKDLKMKIALCEKSRAMEQTVKLKANQAIIFSSENLKETERQMIEWVGSHPFILSSLDSKGLEFDDVIVFFDHPRKTWQIAHKSDATLRMLRELYVAITRAQRRVVILFHKTEMLDFFRSMEYDFHCEGAEMVLTDFDTISSAQEWLKKAEDFLSSFQYHLAARCFNVAGDQAMSYWCSAKFHEVSGDDGLAAQMFLSALDVFASNENHKKVLDVCLALSSPGIAEHSQWTKQRHSFVENAMAQRPDHLHRSQTVKLALVRGIWKNIRIEDLYNTELASLFAVYRKTPALSKIVKESSEEEREQILRSIPTLIGDYHVDRKEFPQAVAAYLKCPSTQDATSITHDLVKSFAMAQANMRDAVLQTIEL